jgi:hypothetical protein
VRLLYFCSKDEKYISVVPIGYKNDLVMFFQISRTLKENGMQNGCPKLPEMARKRLLLNSFPA